MKISNVNVSKLLGSIILITSIFMGNTQELLPWVVGCLLVELEIKFN